MNFSSKQILEGSAQTTKCREEIESILRKYEIPVAIAALASTARQAVDRMPSIKPFFKKMLDVSEQEMSDSVDKFMQDLGH